MTCGTPAVRGLTLLELLVVLAIMGLATAGVSLALRDASAAQLEREAVRLAALLEAGRAASRASGVAVQWQPTAQGFRFSGVAPHSLPEGWLAPDTLAVSTQALTLGPEPVIGAQRVLLTSSARPARTLTVGSDGLQPFAILSGPPP